MLTTNIRPFFSHYVGFDEEAHAFFAEASFGPVKVPLLFIGTNCGRCLLFSSLSLKQIAVLHEDAERRQIVAIGRWPFEEEIKNASSSSKCLCIVWLHFRCHSIALFELYSSDGDDLSNNFAFRPLRELSTGHYGFCHAMSDPRGGRMFIPDHEDLSSSLRIRYRTGGEKVIVFGEQFMNKSWTKRTKSETNDDMFKGQLMGVEQLSQDQILLAFEDSTVCVFDLRTNEVIDALKHPKRPEFLCWSVLRLPSSFSTAKNGIDATTAISPLRALVAVSVIGQLYLLSFCANGFAVDDQEAAEEGDGGGGVQQQAIAMLRAECKVKKCQCESECTALAFCDDHHQQQQHFTKRLASGFKNGIIEIHSVIPSGGVAAGCRGWTTALLAKCDFHAGAAIRVLGAIAFAADDPPIVCRREGKNGPNDRDDFPPVCAIAGQCFSSSSSFLLFSGTSDGKVSLFVMSSQ